MPELPEVENVRKTLSHWLVGQSICAVRIRRQEVVHGGSHPAHLLLGRVIDVIERHGKQLALVAVPIADTDPPCLCIHLGMSGSLRYAEPAGCRVLKLDPHVHLVWRLSRGGCLTFRDPRRFGGIWSFPTTKALLERRWGHLGQDALQIRPRDLHRRLAATRRSIKAVLLDQRLIAGLGNIYVDELLFTCQISPFRRADSLLLPQVRQLVRQMRRLLGRAIEAGGSSVRDYIDGNGRAGTFQGRHRVYGRAGQLCLRCQARLVTAPLSGRTTVFCPNCQSLQEKYSQPISMGTIN